jgi:hypothetical protein
MTILGRLLMGEPIAGRLIKRQIGNMVTALHFLEHLIGANLPTLVNRMEQFRLQPQNPH